LKGNRLGKSWGEQRISSGALEAGHQTSISYIQRRKPLATKATFMQNEQHEVWTTPDFEAIPTNMECTAYSETL
jgi:coenzyme PQQ precursor peptide PqqA